MFNLLRQANFLCLILDGRNQTIEDQAGFPGTGETSYRTQTIDRQLATDIFEVIVVGDFKANLLLSFLIGYRPGQQLSGPIKVRANLGVGILGNLGRGTLIKDPPTIGARTGTNLDDPVRCPDNINVMINDHQRITLGD